MSKSTGHTNPTPLQPDRLARLARELRARLVKGKVVISVNGHGKQAQDQDAAWLNGLRKRLMSLG
jgi:hypothetical protein